VYTIYKTVFPHLVSKRYLLDDSLLDYLFRFSINAFVIKKTIHQNLINNYLIESYQ